MSGNQVHSAVDKATDSDAFEIRGARRLRIASGVLHLLIAYIIAAARVRVRRQRRPVRARSPPLASQTGGKIALWVAAVGLVALGLWRIAEAVIGSKPGERSGSKDDNPAWKRAKSLALAVVNFAIALSAARFAMRQRAVEQPTERGSVRSADAVRVGQGAADRGRPGRAGGRRLPRLQGCGEEVPERPSRGARERRRRHRDHRIRCEGPRSRLAPGCSSSSRRCRPIRPSRRASTPRSRHWARRRSASSCLSRRRWGSPRSALYSFVMARYARM